MKYVQARALADHRFASLDIPYPGEFLDPAREFFPLRPPFVMMTGGTTQAIFPPAAAVIQAVAVAAGGFRGLIVLSLVSAAVVLVASSMLAPPRYALATVVAVGLGGPLWFYAVSASEHAPAVALNAAFAWVLSLRRRRAPRPGSRAFSSEQGATLRDEVMLLAPGLLLRSGFGSGDGGVSARLWRGLLMPLAVAAALEVWWFERPAAAHLRHAVHLVQAALHVTEEPNPELPVLRPMTLRERYDTVVMYWILGRGSDPQVAGFVDGARCRALHPVEVAILDWHPGLAARLRRDCRGRFVGGRDPPEMARGARSRVAVRRLRRVAHRRRPGSREPGGLVSNAASSGCHSSSGSPRSSTS